MQNSLVLPWIINSSIPPPEIHYTESSLGSNNFPSLLFFFSSFLQIKKKNTHT